MNWVDGIILAVLIVSTMKGYLQGFVTTLINTVAFFAAIIAARLYYADLARYLKDNTNFFNKIYALVLDSLKGDSSLFEGALSGGRDLPEAFESLIPPSGAVSAAQGYALAGIAQAVSGIIINLLSIILIFIAVRIAFAITAVLLNSLVRLPVLKQFNKLGGIAAGFIKGVVVLMLAFALVIPVTAIFPAEGLLRGIEGSAAAVYFYRYNFVVPWALDVLSRII
ncbi:MAG TPA: CvpA family protein [Bacillota bacterium]|jgi:uncharacterized membrane protein required for colicin V production|nr:CvpA family protein [Bacillota bacterium]